MSLSIQIDVSGAQEIAANLQGFFCTELVQNVDDAINTTTNNILQTALQLVPVRTGYLKSTLGFQRLMQWMYQLFARANYAVYVEYGTSRMAAEPYMTPAIEQHQADMIQTINDAITSTIASFYAQ
jgi:HK97 gp10 family phage protein